MSDFSHIAEQERRAQRTTWVLFGVIFAGIVVIVTAIVGVL